ncbi:HAD-like domain-containing protein [Kalaharituber pfeilii]|nr:HAD-like domain-containing protein [Kalaharituber pfeilii]
MPDSVLPTIPIPPAAGAEPEATPTENPTIPDNIPLVARSKLRARKRFAPLDPTKPNPSNAPPLKGIVFDFDGTLCEPQNWMFAQMRSALGIAKSVDILGHIHTLPTLELQEAAHTTIQAIERTAMVQMVPQRGLVDLMSYLDSRGIKKAICTRNFDAPVAYLREKFLKGVVFEPVITRAFHPPKPDPAGMLHIASTWGQESGEGLIMVGDSLDDMLAGRRAGAATVLLRSEVNQHLVKGEWVDCAVGRLDDLVEILERGFEEVDRTGNAKESEQEVAVA